MANVYGYIRVSSRDQNEDRQLIALKEIGVADKIFIWTNNPVRTSIVRSIEDCSEN